MPLTPGTWDLGRGSVRACVCVEGLGGAGREGTGPGSGADRTKAHSLLCRRLGVGCASPWLPVPSPCPPGQTLRVLAGASAPPLRVSQAGLFLELGNWGLAFSLEIFIYRKAERDGAGSSFVKADHSQRTGVRARQEAGTVSLHPALVVGTPPSLPQTAQKRVRVPRITPDPCVSPSLPRAREPVPPQAASSLGAGVLWLWAEAGSCYWEERVMWSETLSRPRDGWCWQGRAGGDIKLGPLPVLETGQTQGLGQWGGQPRARARVRVGMDRNS